MRKRWRHRWFDNVAKLAKLRRRRRRRRWECRDGEKQLYSQIPKQNIKVYRYQENDLEENYKNYWLLNKNCWKSVKKYIDKMKFEDVLTCRGKLLGGQR